MKCKSGLFRVGVFIIVAAIVIIAAIAVPGAFTLKEPASSLARYREINSYWTIYSAANREQHATENESPRRRFPSSSYVTVLRIISHDPSGVPLNARRMPSVRHDAPQGEKPTN